jgi:hypothetical protein
MAETRTQQKIAYWPSPQDYNEAIQNLANNASDSQLRNGRVRVSELGLPRALTGAFASVYRVDCPESSVAVRCFLRDIKDQESRYEHISNFVQNDSLPYTVTFDFLRNGIRVGANWYPALKMDWVSGPNIDQYVEKHLNQPAKLISLGESFKNMCMELHDAGIAHGDLQHGNIILCNDELRLVDYDGMYVPAMSGMLSHELGHRNFQHPLRSPRHFGPHLDNFSAWVIYISIRCAALDPYLWQTVAAGDDCLLFRRDDFVDPEHSFVFNTLERHENEEIRSLARFLRWQCHEPIDEVPALKNDPPPQPVALPPLQQYEKYEQPPKSATANIRTQSVPAAVQVKLNFPIIQGVEPELNQSRPRWVRRTGTMFEITSYVDEYLVTSGLPARTIQLSIEKKQDSNGDYANTYFIAHYKFAVNGVVYSGRKRLNVNTGMRVAKDKQVTVLYDPTDPNSRNTIYPAVEFRAVNITVPPDVEPELLSRGRIAKQKEKYKENNSVIGYCTVLLTMLMAICYPMLSWMENGLHGSLFLLALSPFLVAMWMRSKEAKLIAQGVPARARIINVEPIKNGGVKIRYRFQTYTGAVQKSVSTADEAFLRVGLGDKITVLYDIDNPSKHTIYKLSSHEIA